VCRRSPGSEGSGRTLSGVLPDVSPGLQPRQTDQGSFRIEGWAPLRKANGGFTGMAFVQAMEEPGPSE
jgi:hypothetical protein